MSYLKIIGDLYLAKRRMKWSKEKMASYQNKKLRQILHYAWNHSPYYQDIYKKAGITEEQLDTIPLSELPSIEKKDLLNHFDELVTIPGITQKKLRDFDANKANPAQCYQGGIHLVHSSGSTGTPGYFIYDKKAWKAMLIGSIRGALWDLTMYDTLKLLAQRPRIAYIAATDGRYGGVMAVGDSIEGVAARQLNLDIKCPLKEWKNKLEQFNPDIIMGYPTAINILGDLVEANQICLSKISRVVTCGEPLSTGMRDFFEEQFHARILNFYGASESLAIGVEENSEEGMILFDDMNVIEEIDGTMYLTSLYNFAQPLIRYKISDRIKLKKAEDKDRYPFTKAIGLVGRNEDVLWFEDEHKTKEFLHPLAIEGFCIEGLRDYQFRKQSAASFEMMAEVSKCADRENVLNEIRSQMQEILKEKGLDFVKFTVRFVDKIEPDAKTGKKSLILQEERM